MEQQDQQNPDRPTNTVIRVVIAGAKLVAGQLIAWWLREWLG